MAINAPDALPGLQAHAGKAGAVLGSSFQKVRKVGKPHKRTRGRKHDAVVVVDVVVELRVT